MEERADQPAPGDPSASARPPDTSSPALNISPTPQAPHDLPDETLHDDAGYLLVDEQWRILAATDQTSLLTDGDTSQLVGRHARETIGAEALAALEQRGAAIFTLDMVEYTLTMTTFALPTGNVRLIRVQETQATFDQMLSLIVHEVRNPLTAMRALAQGLDETCETIPDGARQRGYTTRLIGEIDRLNRLLASMAHVARPNTRPLERLDLSVALNRVAAIFQPDIARRGVTLNVQTPPDLPLIAADPDQIQQALVNLVKNALEATSSGGTITLRARRDPRGRPMLQVEDTGAGMDTPTLERVFHARQTPPSAPGRQPGTQGAAVSVKTGGMGLGLLIVRSIVHQHHGRLRVVSAPGRGSTISITFPKADEA